MSAAALRRLREIADERRPSAPFVAPGVAASLPHRSIERLVEQWIGAIDQECLRDWARSKAFLRSSAGDLPANDKTAAKWETRFRAAYGRALLSTFRTKFHRGAGSFYFDVVGRTSMETPMGSYIGAYRWAFHAHGAGKKSRVECVGEVARLSVSAVADLIRVGGALKYADALDTASSIWREVATLAAVTREIRAAQDGDRSAFQVRLPLTNEPVILVAAGPRRGEREQLFKICSIRRRSDLDQKGLAAIDALDRALTAEPQKVFGVVDEASASMHQLIDAVRNLGSDQ